MRAVTITGYLLCVAAGIALVIAGHVRRWPFATVSEVLDAVLADRPVRVTLVVFWWWLGWHFLVGQTVAPPLAAG